MIDDIDEDNIEQEETDDSDAQYRDLEEEVGHSISEVEVESQDGFGGDYSRKRQKAYDSITSKHEVEEYEDHEHDFYANASPEDFEKRRNKWRFGTLMVMAIQGKIRGFQKKTGALIHQSKNAHIDQASLFSKDQLTTGKSFARTRMEEPIDLPDARHVDIEEIRQAGKSHDHGRER